MLSVNKPIMDAKFSMLSKKGTADAPDTGGAIYKAAYHAFFDKTYDRLKKTSDPTDLDLYESLKTNNMLKDDNIKKLKEEAHDFASFFADAMDEILKEISSQVDSHIKSASINISVPALLPTIISPMGPCSGSLSISESTGAIINIM